MGRLREAARVLMRHPGLWPEAARSLLALAPRRWWTRSPFLPLPDSSYLDWRIATAYGSSDMDLDGADLIDYLRWRRWQRAAT